MAIIASGKTTKALTALGLATLLTAFSACSSSGDGDGAAAGTPDPEAASAAAARIAPLVKPITSIGITTPLTGAPTPGKLAYSIHLNNDTTNVIDGPFKEATAALGWSSKIIATDASDPQGTSNAIEQAVAAHADYITVNSTNADAIGPGLDAAKAAGIPVILNASVGDVGGAANGVYGNVANVTNIAASGLSLLDWAVADSNGDGHVLFVTYPDAPILAASAPMVESGFKKNCPQCSMDVLRLSSPQVVNGDMTSAIVSEIRKDTSIKYVTMDISLAAVGLREALDSAGLKDVKIGVGYPSDDEIAGIRDGDFAIGLPFGNPEMMYAVVDEMARLDVGMDVDEADHAILPYPLFTKDNLGADVTNYAGPEGYVEQFLKLWGKS